MNSSEIKQYIFENNIHCTKAFVAQSQENYEIAYEHLEKLKNNLCYLIDQADQQISSLTVIRNHREILSKQNYDEFISKNNMIINNTNFEKRYLEFLIGGQSNLNGQNEGKKINKKNVWSQEEHQLFIEAMELYGKKDYKRIAEHIKTRSSIQVRSHQQKHLKKIQQKKIFN